MSSDPCEHKYVFLEQKKQTPDTGGYNIHWVRIDRFYCEKCLEQREVKKDEYSREAPEWW